MTSSPQAPAPPTVDRDVAAEQAIAARGGDGREAVKALIVANDSLEELQSKISTGYARGRLPLARDRKE